MKIGIAGTGLMAETRAGTFRDTDEASVASVFSRTEQKAAKIRSMGNAAYFNDFEAMLDSSIDAVVLCIPNSLHFDYARKALEAGKHVLVEYPLCTALDDAEKLKVLAKEKNKVIMLGNTIIHEATFRFLRENVERIGDIVSASSRVSFYSPDNRALWYMNEATRGPVFAAFHYHHIEYYRHLLGDAAELSAREDIIFEDGTGPMQSLAGGTMSMFHEKGGSSCIQWYLSSKGNGVPRCMWLNGTEGSVTLMVDSPDAVRTKIIWNDGGSQQIEEVENEWGCPESSKDFIKAVLGELDWEDRLDSDIKTLRVALAAQESALKRETVKL